MHLSQVLKRAVVVIHCQNETEVKFQLDNHHQISSTEKAGAKRLIELSHSRQFLSMFGLREFNQSHCPCFFCGWNVVAKLHLKFYFWQWVTTTAPFMDCSFQGLNTVRGSRIKKSSRMSYTCHILRQASPGQEGSSFSPLPYNVISWLHKCLATFYTLIIHDQGRARSMFPGLSNVSWLRFDQHVSQLTNFGFWVILTLTTILTNVVEECSSFTINGPFFYHKVFCWYMW